MDSISQTTYEAYSAYLADVKRLLFDQYTSNNRFFSDAMRSTWDYTACSATSPSLSSRDSIKSPIFSAPEAIVPEPTQPTQPTSSFAPIPFIVSTPTSIPLSLPSPISAQTVVPGAQVFQAFPVKDATKKEESSLQPSPKPNPKSIEVTPIPQEAPSSSRRLGLQPPTAIEPFPEKEWKERLAELMPTLKTCDHPPLPFGERLWGASETDWIILFVETAELSSATEAFVESIKSAVNVCFPLRPIGCLPMQQFAAWSARSLPHCTCIPLTSLEAYMKEPLRKKTLWNELERLHTEAINRSTTLSIVDARA